MAYDNNGTFVLFLQTEKKNEKAPDYTGKYIDENGIEHKIAAWKRVSQNGVAFLSGRHDDFKPEQAPSGYDSFKAQGEKLKQPDVVHDITDEPINLDDIPF